MTSKNPTEISNGEILKEIAHNLGEITIRRWNLEDIEAFADYICYSPKEFTLAIGFNTAVLPSRNEVRDNLANTLTMVEPRFVMGVTLNGKPIARVVREMCRENGEPSQGHFHIFDPNLRNKGLGKVIFKNGLKLIFDLFNEEIVWIEPDKDNVAMNKLLRSLGFKFEGEFFRPSPHPFVRDMEVARYSVRRSDVFE